ncbi:MAG: hypothetical protein R3E96_14215 [Planctomycetota bacterium]
MTEAPRVSAQSQAVTQYIWRGLPMSARPTAQGSITTDFQAKGDHRLRLTTWGSMNLTAGNGDAAFRDGDILDLHESRLIADYTVPQEGRYLENLHVGVVQYGYSGGVGSSTREVYAGTKWQWRDMEPSVNVYWDFDDKDVCT